MSSGKIDWLASYPKSGNTWMRILLANYFNETDHPYDINEPGVTNGIASSRMRFDELLGINSSDLTEDEIRDLQPHVYQLMTGAVPRRQWVKVHDAQIKLRDGRWLFCADISGVVIYLIRNPLDVAVSLAFHDGHGNIDKAVAKMCDRTTTLAGLRGIQLPQYTGTWSHHVESWVDQGRIPTLVVRYEDMLEDTATSLTRVLKFARPTETINQEKLAQAVENSEFDRLQAAERVSNFNEKPKRAKRFFRKGQTGDWRNHLTADQVATICKTHGSVMQRFDYHAEGYQNGLPKNRR